jgi:hypothetical protein
MSNIVKPKKAIFPPKEKAPKEDRALKLRADERPFTTGDFVIDSDSRLFKIGKCTPKGFELLRQDDDDNWTDHYSTVEWKDMTSFRRGYLKLEKSLEEYKAEALHHLSTGFKDLTENPQMSDSTDLVAVADKTYAKTLQGGLKAQQRHVLIIQRTLELMKSQMDVILRNLQEKIKQVTRVVDVIEIYLGVHEKIVQIQEGDPASVDEPITFRQLVLHMDEETAEDMDWTEVETFDKFMREHTDQILPEKKGVVVCRPRAADKSYDPDNPMMNALMNAPNKDTYILIRNGDNLYRIFTNVQIYPHLFPSAGEMKKLIENTQEWGFEKERAEDALHQYKRNVLLLQGLMDRTEVFKPAPVGLNLLKADTYGKHIRFIYDGADLLPGQRKPWYKYLKEMNSSLQRGDRVYMAEIPWGEVGEGEMWRSPLHDKGWRNQNGSPPKPPAGIYNIRDVRIEGSSYSDRKSKIFLINYKHKSDDRYDRRLGYVPRKNAIPFYLHQDDTFIINYEKIKLDDIEFYLNDRVNRRHYLRMMPVLRGIKKLRLEEIEWEKAFVKFLTPQIKHPEAKDLIWDAIGWWKRKVIEKRPLKKEDAKAVRMIRAKVLRMIAGKGNDDETKETVSLQCSS